MDGPRHELAAGARFAAENNGTLQEGDHADTVLERLDDGACAHEPPGRLARSLTTPESRILLEGLSVGTPGLQGPAAVSANGPSRLSVSLGNA